MESITSRKAYKFLSKVDNRRMGLEEVVTFLIPTLNERDGIGLVIDEIKSLGFNKIICSRRKLDRRYSGNSEREGS